MLVPYADWFLTTLTDSELFCVMRDPMYSIGIKYDPRTRIGSVASIIYYAVCLFIFYGHYPYLLDNNIIHNINHILNVVYGLYSIYNSLHIYHIYNILNVLYNVKFCCKNLQKNYFHLKKIKKIKIKFLFSKNKFIWVQKFFSCFIFSKKPTMVSEKNKF